MEVSKYNSAWRGMFAEQRDQLETSLQPWLRGTLEHVGSTAVPGLAAKPIIDIAAPVGSLVEARGAIPVLERAGWLYWPSDPNSSWRLWFLRPQPESRTHHLYLIQHDDSHLHELTVFRNLLRNDSIARNSYAAFKQQLAQQYRTDREGYTAAKASFVAETLQQAGIRMQPRLVGRADQIKISIAASDAGDDAEVRRLLALAAGGGELGVNAAVRQYQDDTSATLLIATLAGKAVGLVGYKVVGHAMVVLLHVATAPHVRRNGVGRRLVEEVRRGAAPQLPVVAETDRDGVNFYRAMGFTVASLGEKYPKVERYRVELDGVTGRV